MTQSLERAGDHARNLAEEVCHVVSGRSVRHLLMAYDKPIEQMFLDWLRKREEKHWSRIEQRSCSQMIFRPFGATHIYDLIPDGLRRGLHSRAASRIQGTAEISASAASARATLSWYSDTFLCTSSELDPRWRAARPQQLPLRPAACSVLSLWRQPEAG